MNKPIRLSTLIALSLLLTTAQAVTVVECTDAEGNSSFRDKCPPNSVKKGERSLTGLGGNKQSSLQEIAAANPIVFYSVPDCDACDLVRNSLSAREIPFTEKDIQDNGELQEELKSFTGGLTVPALSVGAAVVTGYRRDAIDDALAQAGYPLAPSGSQ